MPVIPPGIPPYTITAPLTSGDAGEPTSSIQRDALRVLDFITDERHLTAQALHQNVVERLQAWEQEKRQEEQQAQAGSTNKSSSNRKSPKSSSGKNSLLKSGVFASKKQRQQAQQEAEEAAARESEYQQAKTILEENQQKIETLQHRCRLFRKAQKSLTEKEEWVLASAHFGIDTYYRREDDGTLSLKLEGEMKDIPLFEQVAVLKEVDLHYKWAPFCSSSMTIADLDKLDTVGWFMIGLSSFGIARDGCFRAIGCDNIHEDGSILLAGQGIQDLKPGAPEPADTFLCNDPVIQKLPVPPVPSRRGADRMTIRTFDAIIHVTSPTSAVLKIVANIDPNISFLPQSLLEFIMKQVCGILLAKLQTAAKKVVKNPVTNEHARRMREEEDFYRRWLMAKFESICELKGWEMPVVNAFELSEEQLLHEKKHAKKHSGAPRRGVTFSGNSDSSPAVESVEFGASDDDDLVSELSSRSGISWKKPIRSFVRNREEKRTKQKEQEIREIREIAAQRIQPKERSPSKKERLGQLRDAKARRERGASFGDDLGSLGDDQSATASVGPDGMIIEMDRRSLSEKVTDRLHAHGDRKRFFVMSLCVGLFFVSVHPELLGLLEVIVFDSDKDDLSAAAAASDSKSWWFHVLEGVGFLSYMFLCTILHFATCDIALVYAFDCLELGQKAGREVKKYYSDNIRVLVAAMSLGIYILSVSKALLRVAISFFLAGTFVIYLSSSDYLSEVMELSGASGGINETLNATVEALNDTFENAGDVSSTINENTTATESTQSARTLLLSFLAKFISWTLGGIVDRLAKLSYVSATSAFVASKLEVGDFEEALLSWQTDALGTARLCYSYTLIPLVVFLVLFNYSASSTRRSQPTGDANKSDESGDTENTIPTTVTSPQRTESSDSENNDLPPRFQIDTEVSPNPAVFCKPMRKRRLRGYFRRQRANTGELDAVQEASAEGDELQRVPTM